LRYAQQWGKGGGDGGDPAATGGNRGRKKGRAPGKGPPGKRNGSKERSHIGGENRIGRRLLEGKRSHALFCGGGKDPTGTGPSTGDEKVSRGECGANLKGPKGGCRVGGGKKGHNEVGGGPVRGVKKMFGGARPEGGTPSGERRESLSGKKKEPRDGHNSP